MEPIRQHTGKTYPLYRANIDTDQIIPKQFLKRIERQGFGQFLFYNWRFDENDEPREDFSMNEERYQNASILIAGENFGCGSSREHAPWAIQDYGFKIVIAPSFADIFSNNCVKNGILPIELPEETVSVWAKQAETGKFELNVDLDSKTVTAPGEEPVPFDIADYRREMLLNGWDEIAVTLTLDEKISQYEQARV